MYLTAIIIGLIVATIIYASLASDMHSKSFIEAERNLSTDLPIDSFIAEAMLTGKFKGFQENPKLVTPKRLIVIRRNGNILYDSNGSIDDKNYIDRPEIVQTKTEGTGTALYPSSDQDNAVLAIAKRIDSKEQSLGYALLLETMEARSSWTEMMLKRLFYFFFIAFLLYSLTTYLLINYFFQPINRATNYARKISKGNYIERLPALGQDNIAILEGALNELAVKTEQMVNDLDQNVKNLSNLLEALEVGVVANDANNLIIHINSSTLTIFSLEESPIGKNLLDTDSLMLIWPFVNSLREDQDSPQGTIEVDERILELRANRIIDIDPDAGRILVTLQDATERTLAYNIRIAFVANASHELKTPIAAIQGMIETIIDSHQMLKKTRDEFLLRVSKQTNNLGKTVGQLLQLARFQEVTGDEQDRSQADLKNLIEETISGQEDFASFNNIIIELQKQANTVYVKANIESLKLAFHNLIENGVIYSKPHSTLRVSIAVKAGHSIVAIEDQGIGIPRAEQQRISERFYRIDKDSSINANGPGLGLAIGRAAIQANRGTITVNSTVNKGSVFKVSLPLYSAEPGQSG